MGMIEETLPYKGHFQLWRGSISGAEKKQNEWLQEEKKGRETGNEMAGKRMTKCWQLEVRSGFLHIWEGRKSHYAC